MTAIPTCRSKCVVNTPKMVNARGVDDVIHDIDGTGSILAAIEMTGIRLVVDINSVFTRMAVKLAHFFMMLEGVLLTTLNFMATCNVR